MNYFDFYTKKAEPPCFTGYEVHYEEGKGFLAYKVDAGGMVLLMGDCCGDMAWVHDYCMEKARENGCEYLATFTKRNPKAFLRRAYSLGYDVHFDVGGSKYLANGLWYWLLTEKVK